MLSRVLLIIGLLLVNAFFVAVEFSLVRSRRTKLEGMVRAGDRLAGIALKATGNLVKVLSANQLGITLTSLGIGWVTEQLFGDAFAVQFARLPLGLDST